MRLAREAIHQRSDFSGGYSVLAAAAGMAGHTEAAAAAIQELRRAQPNISLAWITNEMPIMQGTELEHYLEAFRRAGLKYLWPYWELQTWNVRKHRIFRRSF
jgi:hypothetical protein